MTLQDAPPTPRQAPITHRFVPVAEAVHILGLSATTIRRKIDAGELEAERIARPQGTAFLVKVPADEPPRAVDAPQTPQEAPDTNQDPPGRTEGLTAVVVPLVAQIDVLRQTVERQAGRIEELARENGLLTAQLVAANERIAALTAPQQPVEAPGAPGPPEPTREPPAARLLVARLVAVVRAGGRRSGALPSPAMQRAIRVAVRYVASWALGQMAVIEEHVTDPAERWAHLKRALRRLERRRR